MKNQEDCEQILSLLKGGYLDNELEAAAREQVGRHLEECPACRRVRENLAAISLALHNTPKISPPENLWARIEKKIAAGPEALALPSAIDSSEGRAAAPRNAGRASLPSASHGPPRRLVLFFTQRNTLALATAAALVMAAIGFYLGSGRTNNGELAPSLSALIGNGEIHEPNMNFGSNIEKYLL